jgi:hypothetical protein
MKSAPYVLLSCGVALTLLGHAATPKKDERGEGGIAALMRGEQYQGPVVATPRGVDGKPEFTGVWRPLKEPGKPGGNLGKDEPGFLLPLNERGRRAQLYTQNHTVDPEAQCVLGGIPRHNGSGLPFEVLHTPQRIAFAYVYNTSRRITIKAGSRPDAAAAPSYFGSTAAHWEADALVLETIRLHDSSHDRIWLDENGNPTSDRTHVTEIWTRPDYHHLRLEMTVDDPYYYSRPFRFTRTWTRAPENAGLQEYACNESNISAEQIGPGAGPVGPDGNRGFGYEDALPDTPPGPEAYF